MRRDAEVHKLKLANKHQVFNPQRARQCQEKVFNIFVCQSIVDSGWQLFKKAIERANYVVLLKRCMAKTLYKNTRHTISK